MLSTRRNADTGSAATLMNSMVEMGCETDSLLLLIYFVSSPFVISYQFCASMALNPAFGTLTRVLVLINIVSWRVFYGACTSRRVCAAAFSGSMVTTILS